MRYTHVGAGIGLALGALSLQIPAAAAADDSDARIDPWNAYPGSTVTVSTRACDPDVDYGKGWSEVGGEFHLFEGEQRGYSLASSESRKEPGRAATPSP